MPGHTKRKGLLPEPRQASDKELQVRIGQRLRLRRESLGLSLADMSVILGVATSQVHKYEAGVNRISPSRLSELSSLLGVGLRYFFDPVVASDPLVADVTAEMPPTELLTRFYDEIRDAEQRKFVLRLVIGMARRANDDRE